MLWQLWERPPSAGNQPRRQELKQTNSCLRSLRNRGIFWLQQVSDSSKPSSDDTLRRRNDRSPSPSPR